MRKALYLLCCFLLCQAVYPIYFKHIGMSDGLAQTSVMSIYQDQLGRMWFGTREGLTVYDGINTTIYKPWSDENKKSNTEVLYGNECDFIHGNSQGDIFFRNSGALMRYDIRQEKFHVVRSNYIRTVTSYNGEVWCAARDSLFSYNVDADSLEFRLKTDIPSIFCLWITKDKIWVGDTKGLYVIEKGKKARLVIPDIDIYRIFESSSKEIWVGSRMDGLYRIATDGTITSYKETGPSSNHIASNQIREFIEDTYGNIWFGTFRGLQKYNPYTDEFSIYSRDRLPGTLSHSSVFSLYLDRQGTIWAGTYYGGVNYFNPESDIFSHYVDDPTREDCLNYPFVGHMAEDKNGNIWICTEGGGLNFMDRKKRTFRYFTTKDQQNAPGHNNLKSICYDEKNDMLYIGTHTGGLSRFHIPTEKFHNYLNEPGDPTKRPNNIIMHTEMYNDDLYVSARNGTFRMDTKTGEFSYLFRDCLTFTIDSKGYLWYALSGQLIRMNLRDTSDVETFYFQDHGIRFSATCIVEYRGVIYFGTQGSGLHRFNETDKTFTSFTVDNGYLLSNYCYDMAVTNRGELLITSDKGLTFFHPFTETSFFTKLGITLPLASISEGCGLLVCQNNELFVGGTNGFISFWEDGLNWKERDYSLFYSNLYIDNEKVHPGDDKGVLNNALSYSDKIKLRYNQNNIIIQFASNNYVDTQQSNEYEYMLTGFDNEWIPTNMTNIYYTNLNPGSYELLVRERELPLHSPQRQGISLGIHIAQPWYNTIWAWLLYTLTTLAIIFMTIRTRNARRQLAMSLEKERKDKEQSEELNQAKLRFFTNISHEFRTPLTLIISQIELLFQSTSLSPTVYNKIIKISKNANQMRNLISELLEFRKFEQNFVSLRVSEQDFIPFLKDIYLSFYELAAQKHISLRFDCMEEKLLLWFDSNQMQKVFYNLLSNAFKYTKEKGTIELVIEEDGEIVTVKVIDDGIGLSSADAKRIFDRFYQAENGIQSSVSSPGTGIGLALSQNIVELHHGEISVQSELDYGTIFMVRLLKGKEHFENDEKITLLDHPDEPMITIGSLPEPLTNEDYRDMSNALPSPSEGGRYTVLIVEDNEELLHILQTLFAPLYNVLLARDGEEGIKTAMAEKPDLIVSDVMMPNMTGTEMCIRIKNNIDLSHIPVVLLTALNSVEQSIEGLQQGADDYIGKPFHSKALLIRCNNLIRNRLLLQSKFNKQPEFDISLLAANVVDQELLESVTQIIDKYVSDSNFDVNMLARELAMSRSSLFAKFKALTGMTPNDFIQSYRLKRAALLLREDTDSQIVEIAEQLGFSSSVYFSRCFKAQFGVSPAQFRKEK